MFDPTRIFADVEKWSQTARVGLGSVQPGSELAADGVMSSKWQVAHGAVTAWGSSVDNLDALKALMETAIHPYAPYSLLRVAVENAALTVWLLAPAASEERVTRRLQLAWDETHDVDKINSILPLPVGARNSPEQQREQIKALAAAAGLDQSVICGRSRRPRRHG